MSITDINLSTDQQFAMDCVIERLSKKEQTITLGGYAGVGKTTVTGKIINAVRDKFPRIAFACFTGKAYKVLEAKLKAFGALQPTDYCGTIHGLVFNARKRRKQRTENDILIEQNEYTFHDKDENDEYDLIVVDEASMVNEILYNKLLEFDVPILAIGDHGQLPPVTGNFNLMANPQIRLTRIHRQAEGDPIIRLSIIAREEGQIPFGDWNDRESGSVCRKTQDAEMINKHVDPLEWVLIAGTNKKRVERNKWARWKLGLPAEAPIVGDRVVCLQNVHAREVFNGMTGTIAVIKDSDYLTSKYKHPHFITLQVRMDAETDYFGREVLKYQFNQEKPLKETIVHPPHARELDPDDFGHLWDYGYCLTAHKSQGSEFDNVVVYEETGMRKLMERTMGGEGWRRWLYTAVTRAKKQLIIVGE